MKKLFVLLALSLLVLSCYSQEPIGRKTLVNFTVSWGDPSDPIVNLPRNPIDPPVVYLEDYTLTFEVDHPEYVLYIKDEDEVVVYSTVVTSATTEVVLPSTLSGDYEIELIMGDWLFSGWIEL